MIKIKQDIISKINKGTLTEHRHDNLELKSSWDRAYGKKISALSNKSLKGARWLCVGIDDDGRILEGDEQWAKKTEKIVSQHINQYLDPQQSCESITCHQLNNKWFVIIQLYNPGAVVYWNKKAYRTSGTTISEMNSQEIMGLIFKLPGLSDYSAQCFNGTLYSGLVEQYILNVSEKGKAIAMDVKDLSPDEALTRLGIRNRNACKILFGNCPYRVIYYDKKNKPIKNTGGEGMYRIISDDFVQNIQEWSKQQLIMNTNPYPNLVLREALANAVAHAAYFENNGDIIVEIFPEKVSISNLCLGDSVYFANKWFSYAHKTINTILMETLRLSGYVDELGRGKNLIFSESLRYGKKAPQVIIEESGRFSRWRLIIYGGTKDKVRLKLLGQLKERYKDEKKALAAYALVLWRGQPVATLREYMEGEAKNLFAEVLKDIAGPIFYYEKEDTIVLNRWVKVLLGEGKASKQLTPAEEEHVHRFVKKICLDYHNGFVTPKHLRDLAALGHTSSSQVMSSKLLIKWAAEGKLRRIRKGHYKFIEPTISYDAFSAFFKELDIDTK